MTYKITIDPKKTLEDLTKNFDYKYINSDFKLPKGKKETLEVKLVNFGKYFNNNQEVKDAMAEKGLELLTIRQALELANQYPDLQKEKWFGTIEGNSNAYFNDNLDDKRYVRVGQGDRDWNDSYWFGGAVSKLPSVTKPLSPDVPLDTLPFDPLKLEFTYNGRKFKIVEN